MNDGRLGGARLDVDQEGTREGRVRPVLHGLGRRFDTAFTIRGVLVVYRHEFESIRVILVVGQAEVAQGIGVAYDTLNEHVVVFTGGKVRTARARFTYDCFGEIVVRAAVRARSVQHERSVRKSGTYLIPVIDRTPRLPDASELRDGKALDPVVGRIGQHGQPVVCDRQFNEPNAVTFGQLELTRLDRPGRIIDVRLSTKEFGESSSRSAHAHGHAHSRMRSHELLCHGFRNRKYRARAVDLDRSGELSLGGFVAAAAEDHRKGRCCSQQCDSAKHENSSHQGRAWLVSRGTSASIRSQRTP